MQQGPKKDIQVEFISQSIKTCNKDGIENQISKLILSTLGVIAEMHRNQIIKINRDAYF